MKRLCGSFFFGICPEIRLWAKLVRTRPLPLSQLVALDPCLLLMGGAGRLVLSVFLFYGISSRTYVAPLVAEAASTCTSVVPTAASHLGPSNVEKVRISNTPSGVSPRVADPVQDVSGGLALPLCPEREQEWSHSPMVQCVWSPLQGRCLVAGETQYDEEIIEPEATSSDHQERRKEERAPRDARAFWQTYNGRAPECDDSMGPNDTYQTGSGGDGSPSYVYSHGTQRGEVADAGEGALSQAGYVGKGNGRSSIDGDHWCIGRGSQNPVPATVEVDSQGRHATAEGRDKPDLFERASETARSSMEGMGQIYPGQVCGAAEALQDQALGVGGEVHGAEGESCYAPGQDEAGCAENGEHHRGGWRTAADRDQGVLRWKLVRA